LKGVWNKVKSFFGGGDKKTTTTPPPAKTTPTAPPAKTTTPPPAAPPQAPQAPPSQTPTKTAPPTATAPAPSATAPTPVFTPPGQTTTGTMTTTTPQKTGGGAPVSNLAPGVSSGQQQHIELLRAALKERGMNDTQIAAVLGNVGKETGFSVKEENLNYGHTSNKRIQDIFGSRAKNLSEDELNNVKKDPHKMAEMMYGRGSKVGQGMGNVEEGDGYKYRGRGYIQLTGKNNYSAASKEIYGDDRLVKNPDLVSQPEIAAKVAAWFTDKHGKTMAKKMGIDLKNGSQSDVNLAYTSAIAGSSITRGKGYLGGEDINKVDMYSKLFTPGQQDPGMRLTQASTEQKDLNRTLLAGNKGSNVNTVIAPKSSTSNTTVQADVKAQNSESTYQRTMNGQYVAT
jgi:predicted chitinase